MEWMAVGGGLGDDEESSVDSYQSKPSSYMHVFSILILIYISRFPTSASLVAHCTPEIHNNALLHIGPMWMCIKHLHYNYLTLRAL